MENDGNGLDWTAAERIAEVKCRLAREVKWLLDHGFTEKIDAYCGGIEWESPVTKEGCSLVMYPPMNGESVNGWACAVMFGNVAWQECRGCGDDPEDAIGNALISIRRNAFEIIDGLAEVVEDKEGK